MRTRWARKRWAWVAGVVAALVVLVFVASFLVDEPLRRFIERTMNERLDGYTVTIGALDFHPIGLSIDFHDLVLVQDAHPDPPVARIEEVEASVQWRAILRAAVVANFTVRRPQFHVDLLHLRKEAEDEVPVEQRGWQDAVRAMYPLEINELRVVDGELTYVDSTKFEPLKLSKVNAAARNIRNIASTDRVYPSTVVADAVVFDRGRLRLDGTADFLAEPHLGILAKVALEEVELKYFHPILARYHLRARAGLLSVAGDLEYGPKVTALHIERGTLSGADLEYAFVGRAGKEQVVAKQAAREVQQAANRPDTQLRVDRFEIADSRFAFVNEAARPRYRLFMTKTNLVVTNLSNHFTDGTATAKLTGLFMGTGESAATGNFRPETNGPDFDLDVRIVNTQMRGMNDILRAYGKFDVVDGFFSLFAEVRVKNGGIEGYIKPLLRNVDVYDPDQDADKGFFRKVWERVVGAVSKVLENRPRDEVATKAELSGRIDNPRASTWEVIVNLVQNAFFEAILPGFEREVRGRRT
jgi:hypothetical protein